MRLVILDRDGVVNQDSDAFIKTPEEWVPIPGSLEAIGRLCRRDFKVVIATNQSGIAREYLSVDTLNRIHTKMLDHLAKKGGKIDAIFFCPHEPDDDCECRKPKTGMFKSIANRLKVKLTDVPCIGDSTRDLEAAIGVQASPILVRTGKGEQTESSLKPAGGFCRCQGIEVPVYDDLSAAVDDIIENLASAV